MRTIFFILILAVVAGIVGVSTGLINVSQTREARAPGVTAEGGKIEARAGQTPAFDVQTGTIGVGSRTVDAPVPTLKVERGNKQISVPAIEVRRPGAAPTNQAAPAQ